MGLAKARLGLSVFTFPFQTGRWFAQPSRVGLADPLPGTCTLAASSQRPKRVEKGHFLLVQPRPSEVGGQLSSATPPVHAVHKLFLEPTRLFDT